MWRGRSLKRPTLRVGEVRAVRGALKSWAAVEERAAITKDARTGGRGVGGERGGFGGGRWRRVGDRRGDFEEERVERVGGGRTKCGWTKCGCRAWRILERVGGFAELGERRERTGLEVYRSGEAGVRVLEADVGQTTGGGRIRSKNGQLRY